MEFKEISFFDKYKINSFCNSNELFLMFQTNPTYRKDLPVVMSLIKNYKNLFIEELFTCVKENDNDFKRECSILLDITKYFNENLDLYVENFYRIYEELNNKKNIKEYFYYSQFIDDGEALDIFNEYLDCLLNKFLKKIFLNYNDKDYLIIKYIAEKLLEFEKSLDLLDDFIINKIEECSSKTKDNKILKKTFILLCNLPDDYLKREEINNDFLFFIKNFNKNSEDILFTNEFYKKIYFLLDDQEEKAKLLISLENSIFNLIRKGVVDFSKFKKEVNTFLDNYILYLGNTDEKSELFDSCDFDDKLKVLLIYLIKGKDFYNDYFNKLNKLNAKSTPDDVFSFVQKFLEGGFPKKAWIYFADIFIEKMDFTKELEKFLSKFDKGEKVAKRYFMSKTVTYNGLVEAFKENDCYCDPNDVDIFIARTYFLKFFDIFYDDDKNLKLLHASVYYFTGILSKTFNPYLNKTGKKLIYSYRQEFIIDTLKNYPKDWEIFNQENYQYGKNEFGFNYINKYGQSISSSYIKKYETIFKNNFKECSLKGSRFDEIGMISDYKYAVNLYNDEEYEKAYGIFTKLNNFGDSSKYKSYCNKYIQENKYEEAIELYENGDYRKAYEIFISIKDYEDSEEKAKEIYEDYCSEIYDEALEEFENKNYKKVVKMLSPIKDKYPNCQKLLKSAVLLNNETLYKKAINLFKKEDYENALEIFESIKDYKNSLEFINKCNEALKNNLDLNKANELMEEFKKKTFNNFSKINEAIFILEKLSKLNFRYSKEQLNEAKHLKKEAIRNEFLTILVILIIISLVVIAIIFH